MHTQHYLVCSALLTGLIFTAQPGYAKQMVTCRVKTADGGTYTQTVEYDGDIKKGDSCGWGNSRGTVIGVAQKRAVAKGRAAVCQIESRRVALTVREPIKVGDPCHFGRSKGSIIDLADDAEAKPGSKGGTK